MTQHTSKRLLPQTITTGLLIVVTLEVAAVGFRYGLQVVLARLAGANEYGIYTFALTWAQMAAIPAGLRPPRCVVIRYIPQYQAHGDENRLRALVSWTRTTWLLSGLGFATVGLLGVWMLRPATPGNSV